MIFASAAMIAFPMARSAFITEGAPVVRQMVRLGPANTLASNDRRQDHNENT